MFKKYLIGRHFTIYTKHTFLIKLFDPQQVTSATGAARIQRWLFYLSNFNYQVEFREGCVNSNADALSRLSLSSTESTLKELLNFQPVHISLIESVSIYFKQCKMATLRDFILSNVWNVVQRGWPDKCPSETLRPYHLCKTKCNIEESILLWGIQLVEPEILRYTTINFFYDTNI